MTDYYYKEKKLWDFLKRNFGKLKREKKITPAIFSVGKEMVFVSLT
jgi:hypothetical protein